MYLNSLGYPNTSDFLPRTFGNGTVFVKMESPCGGNNQLKNEK